MAKKELARDRQNTPRIQRVVDALYGGHIPIDPVPVSWQDSEASGPTLAYHNYHLGRTEVIRGRIPKDRLWEYSDPAYPDDDDRTLVYDRTAGKWVEEGKP